MVRSRLQKQVLSLYRKFLRASQDKPGFTDHIKHEFRKNSVISKTDGLRIEYLLRRAQNQLKQLEKMETKSMGFFTQEAASDKSWIFGTCLWFVNYVTFEKWSKRRKIRRKCILKIDDLQQKLKSGMTFTSFLFLAKLITIIIIIWKISLCQTKKTCSKFLAL